MNNNQNLDDVLEHFHIDDENAQRAIAKAIIDGEVVAINFEGHLYALVCDARNPKAVENMYLAKNRPKHKTMSAMANLGIVCELTDMGELPEHGAIKKLFSAEGKSKLIEIFAKNGFINIVLHKDASKHEKYKIPLELKSADLEKEFFQVISVEKADNEEHTGASKLQETVLKTLEDKHSAFGLLAITSMNMSGIEESIISKEKAIEFCKKRGIKKIMHGPELVTPQGSYSITKFRKNNLDLGSRQGKGLSALSDKLLKHIDEYDRTNRHNTKK